MADSNNYSDLNDNFDTIKTMLNSIRAQGILNTSDVDKLLEGINSKLEKINTEEDIDLIKAFLSELKKNLDERHDVLISKFGAIESLFSNLMKNSTDTVKSPELKELFDIVATNLSVFSREVVSQKESLTDITLRLDAMRSDDSQKKDIIKSITTVRNDIDKVNNAFDSVVISLNENFKTVLKTIADGDKTEKIQDFADKLTDILNSSTAILSAIQLIDKKNIQIEETFEGIATEENVNAIQKSIVDLSAKSNEIVNLVDTLTQKSYKIDNLTDKIDATVNIIVGLKTELIDNNDSSKTAIIDKLNDIESSLKEASSNSEFEKLKQSLETVLNNMSNGSEQIKTTIENALSKIANINEVLQTLNLNIDIQKLSAEMESVGENIKEKVASEADKLSQMLEVHISRTLDDISTKAEAFDSRLKNSNSLISELCEKNFAEVSESIGALKNLIAQLDENNISANNAIFANITDRFLIFENSLKTSLEKQENYVSGSTGNLFEQISNMKNLTEGLDYKLDSNAIELGNAKNELKDLSESINNLLALDYVNVVKDFKIDLYAIKQDMLDYVDSSKTDILEKSSNDLFGKYELLISKLDSVEDEVKSVQGETLKSLNGILNNISSSIVDILSYVSTAKEANYDTLDKKLSEVTTFIQDNNLNYIENVRDIVDVVKVQIENSLKQFNLESIERLNKIETQINDSQQSVKDDIKTAYNKLLEVQANVISLNEEIKANNDGVLSNVNNVLESADNFKADFDDKLNILKNSLLEVVTEYKNDFTCKNTDNMSEIKFNAENLHSKAQQQSIDLKNELKEEIFQTIDSLKLNILNLNESVSNSSSKIESANKDIINFIKQDFTSEINNSVDIVKTNTTDAMSAIDNRITDVINNVNKLDNSIIDLSKDTKSSLTGSLAKILENFVSLNSTITNLDEQSAEKIKENAEELKEEFEIVKKQLAEMDSQIDEDLARQINIIEGSFESLNLMLVDIMNQAKESLGDKIKSELSNVSGLMSSALAEELEQYKVQIEDLFEGIQGRNNEQAECIKNCTLELNNVLASTLDKLNKDYSIQLEDIESRLKEIIQGNIELTSADYESLKEKLNVFASDIEEKNNILVDSVKAQIDDIVKFVNSSLDIQSQDVNSNFEEIASSVQKVVSTVRDLNNELEPKINDIKTFISEELKPEIATIENSVQTLFEDHMIKFVTEYSSSNSQLSADISSRIEEFKSNFIELKDKLQSEESIREESLQKQINELNENYNNIITEVKDFTKTELQYISDNLKTVEQDISCDINKSLDSLNGQFENIKQNSKICTDLIENLVKEHSDIISKNIEKETDVIVGDILEQFSILKDSQKDEFAKLTTSIEGSVSGYIIDSVNDLKQYMDVKTDFSSMDAKLDTFRNELASSIDDTLENVNKLLEVSVFSDAISDLKTTNEILVTSMTDKLNSQITDFVKENVSKKIDEKIGLLDKKFVDTIVDKYEEVKLLTTQYNTSFEKISFSVEELISKFVTSKNEINANIKTSIDDLNNSIGELKASFVDLKAQIMNKSFDEAFHASVHNQISGIENLVQEQFRNLEDINDLCSRNLPELTEMSTIVKYGIKKTVDDISEKISLQDTDIKQELNNLKSGIITQFINIFNQISFVTEQEEILDFIDEKHSELIKILSHIVTSMDGVETVKNNLTTVDNKINTLKEDINQINEKITSIMSSEGDIDYVYSLQDLESDIANLRLVLNDMKSEMPKFEADEFKKDFNNLAEDIISISTRTNKLILTSDESYKTLQDNLQDFRLVIDDLDERTKNFAKDSGIDKLDNKLATINSMIKDGAKTNQVFNQVFEYLAEWVDRAGEQIASISDKVETLDDINQIKIMLEDLRAENNDTANSNEIVEALEKIFDKQAKRMASLEAKIDKMTVNSTVNSKTNKNSIKPIEDTLNKFLVAMGDTISSQQEKINSLEAKLEKVVSLMDNKDTSQLTKKVGGMDRQLAKLNKSIEKIASNVVEK